MVHSLELNATQIRLEDTEQWQIQFYLET